MTTKLLTYTPIGKPAESIQSGNYGEPPNAWWWFKQSIIYFCGLMGMKLCVLIIFMVFPWISQIVTGRGNSASYPFRGLNFISSILHWGVSNDYDRYYWTWGWTEQRRSYYNAQFHTYGIEWTDKYLWTCQCHPPSLILSHYSLRLTCNLLTFRRH